MLSMFEINSYNKDDIIIVREERQARIKETKVMSYILCIIILYSQSVLIGSSFQKYRILGKKNASL